MCQECDPKVVQLASTPDDESPVVARVPQGFDANVKIRFLPERSIDVLTRPKGCHPRQGAERNNTDTVALPPELPGRLKERSKAVVAWLAKSPDNARAFLDNPVEALAQAELGFERAELKALSRTHEAVRNSAVLGPGVSLETLEVEGATRGKVGDRKPQPTREIDC